MPANAMKLPSASVLTPDKPWPMVQPIAVTPPTPIRNAPPRWLAVSSAPAKTSQRKLRSASATSAAPSTTPNTQTMPSASTRLVSLNSISHSKV
jgi:hypothetical protein